MTNTESKYSISANLKAKSLVIDAGLNDYAGDGLDARSSKDDCAARCGLMTFKMPNGTKSRNQLSAPPDRPERISSNEILRNHLYAIHRQHILGSIARCANPANR